MNDNYPLTVVIADDELPLRQELRLFPWEMSNAVLVGEAKNGEEGIQLCQDYAPDVVITDLSMPVMDGLEFIRWLKKECPHTQIIILTCHSDFQFAQEALKLGTLDYLVKVDWLEEHLHTALAKARNELKKHRLHSELAKKQQRLQQAVRLTEWLQQEPVRPPLQEYFEGYGLSWTFPTRLFYLHADPRRQDWLFVEPELHAVAERVMAMTGVSWTAVSLGGESCLLLPGEEAMEQWDVSELPTLHDTIGKLILEINLELGRRLSFLKNDIQFHAVISDIVQTEQELAQAISRLELWNDVRFYEPDTGVFLGTAPSLPLPDKAAVMEIEECLRRSMPSPDQLMQFIREDLTNWAMKSRFDPNSLKQLVLGWRSEWYAQEAATDRLRSVPQRIMQAPSMFHLTAELLYEARVRLDNGPKLRAEIIQAKRIMEERLGEELTLIQVSREVGLRDYYFSRLFREETGESFHEQLTRLRLEKAIKLLQSTNLKVYEIAEEVGLPNYRYFSILFRKWTGHTPSDYKRSPSS
jgi:two-component system response regulator YesN